MGLGELACRPMTDVTIYHNPRCSKSRQGVAALADAGVAAQVVRYLDEPLDRAALTDLLAMLTDDEPGDLVRRDPRFRALGLTSQDVATPEQVVDVLAAHPELMERPVLVRDGKAIIGRPTERIAAFLA